ncbi:MAG: hypothetical protein WBD40_23845 [Tepidisphaeraceae bacterium]
MTRAAINLGWEVFAKAKLTLISVGSAVAIACVFALWRGSPPAGGVDGFADLLTFGMVLSMLFVFGVFNHTHLDRRSGQTGFPNRLFTYPVSTRLLVAVPMACGVLVTVGVYLAWCGLVLRPLGRVLPAMWPALVLATAMAWYQAALWSLAAFRIARMVALCLLGTTLITIALLPAVAPGGHGAWAASGSLNATMAALLVIAYAVALYSVKRQRHAGGHGAGFRFIVERFCNAIPSRTKPFRSPAHAQFWLESQRGALLLPAGTLLVMLFVMFIATVIGRVSADSTVITLVTILATPFVLASLAGSVAAISIVTAADSSLSPFLATRPISCGDMVFAKVQAAALSSALAWVVVLVLTPVWLMVWCDTSPVAVAWRYFSEAFPGNRRWLMLAMVMITLWLTTWRMAVVNLYVAVAGRPVQYVAYVITGIAVHATVATIVVTSLAALVTGTGESSVLVNSPAIVALLMFVALVAKVFVALLKGKEALDRGWMTERAAVVYLTAWLIATALVTATLYLGVARIEAKLFPTMPWLKHLALLAGLLLLPVARLALAPRVLASNRHR